MINLGDVPASSTLYIPFTTYSSAGASVTCSGLAVSGIKIYKNGSTTQRASSSGITLLDTDGIDFDGITGFNAFSVDLSNNDDSGFYSVGGYYWAVVDSITVDSQIVKFPAATFRIAAPETVVGYQKVDIAYVGGVAASGTSLLNVNVTGVSPAAITSISSGVLYTALTETYATDGAAPTLTQAVLLTQQHMSESSVSGTTKTVKKLDGSTNAATFTLNSATTPTSITRST